jgi:NADH-quinone oxidoreductase subunit J
MVVLAKNPLHGALYLVCCFFFLAGLYILLGAHLVGALQIIVYAGAIMVLFLFVIMLLALTDTDLGDRRVTVFKVVGGVFSVGIIALALNFFGLQKGAENPLIFFLRIPRQLLPEGFGTVAAVGRVLFNDHVLQFEAVSLLLLVAIVGSVVVAKGRI